MRLCEVPAVLVRRIAREAIASYREYRDAYGYDEERAEDAAEVELLALRAVEADAIAAKTAAVRDATGAGEDVR